MPAELLSPLLAVPRAVLSPRRPNLRAILEPGVSLAVWEREITLIVQPLLAQVASSPHPLNLDILATPQTPPGTAIQAAAEGQPWQDHPFLPLWLEDVNALTQTYRGLVQQEEVRVRLETVFDPACAVFHVDTLGLRLLCTYHGHGTQWLTEENARREELGLRDRSVAGANAAIVRRPESIRTLGTGHVAIFKGRLFPGGGAHALVHRSYPLCPGESARLRLCIDLPR